MDDLRGVPVHPEEPGQRSAQTGSQLKLQGLLLRLYWTLRESSRDLLTLDGVISGRRIVSAVEALPAEESTGLHPQPSEELPVYTGELTFPFEFLTVQPLGTSQCRCLMENLS